MIGFSEGPRARLAYAPPTLSRLSVKETRGGTVPDFFESNSFTGEAGTVRGANPNPS
jgi:hypothetical protein